MLEQIGVNSETIGDEERVREKDMSRFMFSKTSEVREVGRERESRRESSLREERK